VEMGGVEPPSRAFSRGYATGLVGVLLSLPGSHRQDPGQPSRITLDLARTGAWARGTLVLRRPLRTHQGRVRADVAASITQPERAGGCQLLCCPFLRVRGRPRPAILVPTALSNPVIPKAALLLQPQVYTNHGSSTRTLSHLRRKSSLTTRFETSSRLLSEESTPTPYCSSHRFHTQAASTKQISSTGARHHVRTGRTESLAGSATRRRTSQRQPPASDPSLSEPLLDTQLEDWYPLGRSHRPRHGAAAVGRLVAEGTAYGTQPASRT